MIQKTIREYYTLCALHNAAVCFHATTYVIFLQSKGLNLFEVNLVNVVFFTTLFICEIPTGAFADVFGRKASCITAYVIQSIGLIAYGFSDSFLGFALSEGILAIGATFMSGALSAWFVDKLHHHGYSGRLDHFFARSKQISNATGIIFAFIGAYLSEFSLALPWFCGGVFLIVSAIFASTMKEEYFTPQEISFKRGLLAMRETIVSSFKYGCENKNVRFVLVLVMVQILAVSAPNMQWQPLFIESLPNRTSLGFIWTGVSLTLIFGSWLAPKILNWIKDERKALALCQTCAGLGITFATTIFYLPSSLFFFLFQEVARGAFGPIKEAYLHDNIPSKERATIESFESLAHHAGGAIGLFLSGALAHGLGIRPTWIIAGLFMVIATSFIMRNGKK